MDPIYHPQSVTADAFAPPMTQHTDRITKLAYEYQQLAAVTGAGTGTGTGTDSDSRSYEAWVDPSVYADTVTETSIIKELIDAERYPGEAFVSVVEPDPEATVPAFADDVGITAGDIIGFAAPSTQLCDDLFYSLYRSLAETGAILTTKYPGEAVRERLETVSPTVLDCTPGAAETEDTPDAAITPLRCSDLTAIGVAAQSATDQLAVAEPPRLFGLATVTQLLSHHDESSLSRFLHQLAGQWRNNNIGGLVHVPPVSQGRCFGVEHFDYVLEVRIDDHTVEARARGKRDTDTAWRSLGVSRHTTTEQSSTVATESGTRQPASPN